jgi:Zn-dependent membrane protease YugP
VIAMRRIDTFKLSLAACAVVLVFWGIRIGSEAYRWAGIALLAAAVMLRFIRPRPPLD